ncbi:MAG: arginase [Bacilli bacterium]|nr:arginase [Bacilli bacterium]
MNKIDIIEAKNDLGVSVDGANIGPSIIMKDIDKSKINKIYTLEKPNYEKETAKDNLKKNLKGVNEFNEKLYKMVSDVVNEDNFPLTLGGDHTIAIASALASIKKRENLGIIWVDAHGDFNTFKTTITGNLHGLPLAVITGYEKELLSYFHDGNFYPFKNTVILGARDIDPLELENLKDANVTIITTADIHKYGALEMTKKAIEIASKDVDGLHISYDIDVIDPQDAPGVSVPAISGIKKEEAYIILDELLKYKNIKSMDVVEFNPLKDIDDKTKIIADHIVNEIINKKTL